MQQNYDKFSYSHQRNRSEREESSYKSPTAAKRSTTPNKKSKQQQNFSKQHDASISVLHPLKHGAYSFAVAEDGILHSRIVAPPRICYAPVISELDAPTMPDTPWERLKKLMQLSSQKDINRNNTNSAEVNFAEFGAFDWDQVVAAINALEQQDLQREESLAATLEESSSSSGGDENNNMSRRIALYKDRKSMYEAEKVTAVDRAKIELIWKKARMMLVDNMNKNAATTITTNRNEKPLAASVKYEDVNNNSVLPLVPVAAVKKRATTTSPSAGGSRASSPAMSSRASSAARAGNNNGKQNLSRENSFTQSSVVSSSGGGRGTIFNEKLKWTDKPRVDSNNSTNPTTTASARSRRF